MASGPVASWLVASVLALALVPNAEAQTARSVSFLATADPQFENDPDETEERQRKRSVQLAVMRQLSARVRQGNSNGIIVAGDLTQNSRIDEFEAYLASIAGVADRVYDGLGNHDMESGNCCVGLGHSGYCTCPLRIAAAVATRPRQTAKAMAEGYHYSWDWQDVHVVQLNLYPADGPGAKTYSPGNALSFLKRDLAAKVGTSGRPVVLVHHYGMDDFSIVEARADTAPYGWTPTELAAYWDAIADYNVILIVTGHLHYLGLPEISPELFWFRSWGKPSGATRDRTTSVPRVQSRTIEGKATTILDNSKLASYSSAATRIPDVLEDLIQQAAVRFDASPDVLSDFRVLGWHPRVIAAIGGAVGHTIPVITAGGAYAFRDSDTKEAWGYFVQVDITSDGLTLYRYKVSSSSPTAKVIEIISLPFVARPAPPPVVQVVAGSQTSLAGMVSIEPWSSARGTPVTSRGAAGNEGSGQGIFACRGSHQGGVYLGKQVSDGKCHVGYGGQVVKLDYYDLISVDSGVWGGPTNPQNALAPGTEAGKPVLLCRARYSGGVHPGKVVSGKCGIAFGNTEIQVAPYELLYRSGSNTTRPVAASAAAPPPPPRVRAATFGFWEVWSRQERIVGSFGAVGQDRNGFPLFACRFEYQGGVHPGTVYANDNRCYISYGGQAIGSDNYDLFRLEKGTWGPLKDPATAMQAGEETSRPLLLCRAFYEGIRPGKVVEGKCNIAVGSREVEVSAFEVLYP